MSTTYRFEYGTTTSYGTKVPLAPQSVGSGTANVKVAKAISGLQPGTTYHYRVVATNPEGIAKGKDQTFTAKADPRFSFAFGKPGFGKGQFNGIQGIAIDTSSNVWVAEAGNNRIQKFNPEGIYQSQFGAYGSGTGQFLEATVLAAGSSGSIWVGDSSKSEVQKWVP